MLTQLESAAPAAASGASRKLLQLLRKRLRQLLRVTLVLATCLALAATALAIWWLMSLNGLPNIGDPFDVAAFRAYSLPEDRNAFAYLQRASRTLTPGPLTSPSVPWSQADPKLREWSRRIARRLNCISREPNNQTPHLWREILRMFAI
jgi:hypothetical protein